MGLDMFVLEIPCSEELESFDDTKICKDGFFSFSRRDREEFECTEVVGDGGSFNAEGIAFMGMDKKGDDRRFNGLQGRLVGKDGN